jgi:hypothetical protein
MREHAHGVKESINVAEFAVVSGDAVPRSALAR